MAQAAPDGRASQRSLDSGDRGAVIARIVDHIRAINRQMRAGQTQNWTTLDLTMAQLKILFLLANQGPSAVSGLANALGVTLPSVTGTVERLVRQHLVERHHDQVDRRVVMVQLTAEGRHLIEGLQQGQRARLTQGLEQLSADDLAALDRGLAALTRAMHSRETTE